MSLNIKKTSTIQATKLNAIIYGISGSGKTTLASTLKDFNPLVISLEAGLLSLKAFDVDYVEVDPLNRIGSLKKILEEVKRSDYKTIVIDSLTEISEAFYEMAKAEFPDSRNTMQRYGHCKELMVRFLKYTRDFDKNVIYTALQKDDKDDTGRMSHLPKLVGSVKEDAMAFMDFVFCLRVVEKDGEPVRFLQTGPGHGYQAKDRSGKLDEFERPDLGAIINKVFETKGE